MNEAAKTHLSLVCNVVLEQQRLIDDMSRQIQALTRVTDGTFLWKVPAFKSKSLMAKSTDGYEIKSDPFYTSPHGYRLRMSIFPNGNGSGEGTHLSIYIHVLPGEYDGLLEWPFHLPIVFQLYDQCTDIEKRRHIVESFVPNPSWKQFQRPAKDATEGSGFGYPKFIHLDILRTGTFVRDDSIFIKIRADMSKFIEP